MWGGKKYIRQKSVFLHQQLISLTDHILSLSSLLQFLSITSNYTRKSSVHQLIFRIEDTSSTLTLVTLCPLPPSSHFSKLSSLNPLRPLSPLVTYPNSFYYMTRKGEAITSVSEWFRIPVSTGRFLQCHNGVAVNPHQEICVTSHVTFN